MRLNLGAGAHQLDGFANHDPLIDGWRFEDGLPQYGDNSVEGITISHALMYVPIQEWRGVFDEFCRVLAPGGVVRITEDNTNDPKSERYCGHHDAITLTSHQLVIGYLICSELLTVSYLPPHETLFHDDSLIQRHHGDPPKVFFVEGVK